MEGLILKDVLQLCVALAARASLHMKKTTGQSGLVPVILWKVDQHTCQHISGKLVGQRVQH